MCLKYGVQLQDCELCRQKHKAFEAKKGLFCKHPAQRKPDDSLRETPGAQGTPHSEDTAEGAPPGSPTMTQQPPSAEGQAQHKTPDRSKMPKKQQAPSFMLSAAAVPAQRQPGSAAKQASKALQQALSKVAMQPETVGIPVPKATLLKKKQQPAPGKLLAITQHGEPQGKRKRAINCQEVRIIWSYELQMCFCNMLWNAWDNRDTCRKVCTAGIMQCTAKVS